MPRINSSVLRASLSADDIAARYAPRLPNVASVTPAFCRSSRLISSAAESSPWAILSIFAIASTFITMPRINSSVLRASLSADEIAARYASRLSPMASVTPAFCRSSWLIPLAAGPSPWGILSIFAIALTFKFTASTIAVTSAMVACSESRAVKALATGEAPGFVIGFLSI